MLLKICTFICLFLIQFTTSATTNDIQNLELDDITSLSNKFPILIDKINEAVNRFRCPKGWKRLGGSCYYFSNLTSTSARVNYTCNYFHSNSSNLMQIRNAVELFYAAHVLTRNNLSSLMIEIDSNLLKGKKISEILIKDKGLWERMKKSLQELRIKYQQLKRRIVDRLSSAGLRILRRSKKIKAMPSDEELMHDQYHEYDYDHEEFNSTDWISSTDVTANISSVINSDEYEYDDLDTSDEIDPFEQIEDIRGICDDIHWNVLNNTNNSTVFILTKYNVLDKMICSLSDVDSDTRYHHVCEYVLDFCFANIMCGKHGRCEHTLTGFKCTCSFLYGGLLCEAISDKGHQIIISFVLIMIMLILTIKRVQFGLGVIMRFVVKNICVKICKKIKPKRPNAKDDTKTLLAEARPDSDEEATDQHVPSQRRQTIIQDIMEYLLPRTSNPLSSPIKRNLARNIWVGTLSIILLSLLFFITTIMYYLSFGHNMFNDEDYISINDTIRQVTECIHISDYRNVNLAFAPFACVLILMFSWSIKRENRCLNMCDGRPGLIPPIEPFRTANRFTTATVFGILAFEVLKIFEELLFSTAQPLGHGVLIELLIKIALVIVIGLRYYPILASLQLRNLIARFFACLYIICNIVYTIIREGSCMGFLPLYGQYTALEEAKLRRELGTWFIIYGLIKNIPHFFFLSYIGAELCVRFAYDSIYVPMKKKRSIWSTPIMETDESEFAKYYVTKLFRRRAVKPVINVPKNVSPDDLIDHEHDAKQQNQATESRFRECIDSIYHSDDDFRFTTMAMCTYTVAVVFLYYLACTFVFLYVTRTTGHVAFLKFYIESTFNVDLGAFSFTIEIIISAILTGTIYAGQLFIGIQNYKKHKLQLYRGICIDILEAETLKADYIASNSVHYSGFLVGYMAWGFVICFHLILSIAIGIRVLTLQIRSFEVALSIIVPILVIYLLKILGMTSAGKYLFIQKKHKQLDLQKRRTYAIFLYFSFFADCFLGAASCIIRLIKATFLNVIFMARLDWSFLGRPMERYDLGFAAYSSYLHMEVAYTNPVMLAFCYSLQEDIVQRRAKSRYVDECCIAETESDRVDDIEAPRPTPVQQSRSNLPQNLPTVQGRRIDTNHRSTEENSNPNESKRTSHIEIELSAIPTRENQKNPEIELIQKPSDPTNQEYQSNISTRFQASSEQPRLSGPQLPRRTDISSSQDGSNDDSQSKQKRDNRKNTSSQRKKDSLQSKTSLERNGDDERTSKADATTTISILSKQQTLDKRKSRDVSSSGDTDDDLRQSSEHSKSAISTSHETVNEKASKKSNQSRNEKAKESKDKNPYETVSIEEERGAQETTVYSLPSKDTATNRTDINTLRTMSYYQAQHKTPPLPVHRQLLSSTARRRNHTNDDTNHYSVINNDRIPYSVENPSYSRTPRVEAPSDVSSKPKSVEEQKDDEDTNAEAEAEEKQDEERVPFLRPSSHSPPIQPTATTTTDLPVISEAERERLRIKRRKQVRFRWHFLYTMLRNYQLFDIRKDIEKRLILLHLQRSTLINDQRFTPIPAIVEIPTSTVRVVELEGAVVQVPIEPDVPASAQPPPSLARQVSVAASTPLDYPTSPAERYMAIRSKMVYDTNNEQPNTANAVSPSYGPTTVSANLPHSRTPIATTLSNQSLGFPASTNDPNQPLSEFKANLTPSPFQHTPGSNQSTADYPLIGSSVVSSPTYCTQLSFDQKMQAWRQAEIKKIQQKQRHPYVHGKRPKAVTPDPVSSTVVLTPKTLFTPTIQQQVPPTPGSHQSLRPATETPFTFPPTQPPHSVSSKNENLKSKVITPRQEVPIPPQRMDRVDEDPQETSNANDLTITTSALVHEKDSE